MGRILDKRSVLDRIKQHYELKGNADLARFLGIAPNTITNWYNRETFDIDRIYTNCVDVDIDWLLTGKDKGEITQNATDSDPKAAIQQPEIPIDSSIFYMLYKDKNTEIEKKEAKIEERNAKIEALAEEIGRLKAENMGLEEENKELLETLKSIPKHAPVSSVEIA